MDLPAQNGQRSNTVQRLLDELLEKPPERGKLRLQDPNTGRYVNVNAAALPAIAGLMPVEALTRIEEALKGTEQIRPQSGPNDAPEPDNGPAGVDSGLEHSKKAFLNAFMAARKNYINWQRIDTATLQYQSASADARMVITLTADAADKQQGYYFPEKGPAAWFKAHGRLSLDPHQIERQPPKSTQAMLLQEEMAAHASDPHARFAVIRHGRFAYLLQAKKLNGRKRLFAKLIHDGTRVVHMTHWAKVSGGDPARLMRLSGIDPRELDP